MNSMIRNTAVAVLTMMSVSAGNLFADPMLTSWFTKNAGQYARIQQTTNGAIVTTWTGQTLPAYSDIEVVSYSTNYVYVYSSGLASHVMGPWYLNAAKTMLFPNLPKNQKVTMRFSRTPVPASMHTETTGGAMGMYVNGVAVFNMLDGYAYNTSSGSDQQGMIGTGIWERDAKFGEAVTFDPANAHQPGSGQYHCHINPIALRYQLGDNATYNSSADTYSENTNNFDAFAHRGLGVRWVSDLRAVRIFQPDQSCVRRAADDFRLRAAQWPVRHEQSERHGTHHVAIVGTGGTEPHQPDFQSIRAEHDESGGHDR